MGGVVVVFVADGGVVKAFGFGGLHFGALVRVGGGVRKTGLNLTLCGRGAISPAADGLDVLETVLHALIMRLVISLKWFSQVL